MTGEVTLETNDHLVQPLIAHAEATPARPLLAYRAGDRFVDVTAADVVERVRALAKGLMGLGIQSGDRVALMSGSRLEWPLLDYAILAAGGVTVPIYETSSSEQVQWIVSDSGAVGAFFENAELKAEYDEIADEVPDCRHVFVIEDGLEPVVSAGKDVSDEQLDERLGSVTIDDLATIIYTSGTTGRPKGCLLTHGNLRWDVVNTVAVIGDLLQGNDSQLLFLPLAHAFAKILMLASIEQGVKVGIATSPHHIIEEMPLFRPTYIAAVPRIFEKVYAGAQQQAQSGGKGAIFDKAADVAVEWSRQEQAGGISLKTKLLHALFDRLVYTRLRDAFGGRLRAATSGGGPLGERLGHFFHGIGVEIYEGYGLTETSPVLTANRPDHWKIGTVGQPIPGTTIKIAEDGEILGKGGQIFQGYHNNEQATSEAIDGDGFFHTGDLGELDDEGYLKITGRKKEMIVTAAGKNVAPAVLEERAKSQPIVSQVMVIGDNRRFISALVTIDEEAFPHWASQHGKEGKSIADLTDDPELRATVQEAVDHANKAVSRAESIREFVILPQDFSIESGELTPTLKVKRKVVQEHYAEQIEAIYGE